MNFMFSRTSFIENLWETAYFQKQPPDVFYENKCFLGLPFYLKRGYGSKNTFFTEHLRETASLFHVEVAEFQPADTVKN